MNYSAVSETLRHFHHRWLPRADVRSDDEGRDAVLIQTGAALGIGPAD